MGRMDELDLTQIKRLTHMIAPNIDGNLLVPSGVVPKYAHQATDGRWSVYVENWTSKREFDNNCFYLYPLLAKNQRTIYVDHHEGAGKESQLWYTLDEPTRRATKQLNDHFVEQVCLRASDGSDSLFPPNLPLPDTLKEGDMNQGIIVTRRYLKSEQTDDEGRIVYNQG